MLATGAHPLFAILPTAAALQKQVEQSILDAAAGLFLDFRPLPLPHQADRTIDQLTDDALHVAAVVADFGVLRRLNLEKRRASQLRQAAGNLRFAHARRA